MKNTFFFYTLGTLAFFIGAWILFFAVYGALTIFPGNGKLDLRPEKSGDIATWFQAIGSVAAFFAAIWAATLPIRESRLQLKRKGAVAVIANQQLVEDAASETQECLHEMLECSTATAHARQAIKVHMQEYRQHHSRNEEANATRRDVEKNMQDGPEKTAKLEELTLLCQTSAEEAQASRSELSFHEKTLSQNQAKYATFNDGIQKALHSLQGIKLQEVHDFGGEIGALLELAIQKLKIALWVCNGDRFNPIAIEHLLDVQNCLNRYRKIRMEAERILNIELGPAVD